MGSPELDLQGEIVKRLKADPAVAALVNSRIYDQPPTNAVFPYVTYTSVDALSIDAECIRTFDISVQLDAWSRAPGFPECHRIVDAVRKAIDDAPLALPNANALVLIEHRQSITRRDPDGLTNHGIMQFNAIVEQE